jgi:hypothetical protein
VYLSFFIIPFDLWFLSKYFTAVIEDITYRFFWWWAYASLENLMFWWSEEKSGLVN